jgi:hypothetical protein
MQFQIQSMAQINLRMKHLHSKNSKHNFVKWSELPRNCFDTFIFLS